MQAHVEQSLAGPRAISAFLSVMAAIALALSAMGIYGVMSHAVTQQNREIGIRMALGADRGTVVGMVTRSGMTLVGVGILLGSPLAFLMARGVSSALNLFEADVGMGMLPVVVGGALTALALVSILLPAARASRVAPVTALREG
jgi:ABC-type antimicrobial peptide transport system permease subunit